MKSIGTLLLSIAITTFSFAQSAEELFKQGLENVKRINRVDATKNFTDAIDLKADYSEAYYQRGLLYVHFKKISEAISDFKKVTEIKGALVAESNFELGKLYFEKEEYLRSEDYFTKVLDLDSTSHEAIVKRGISKYFNKDYDQSIEDLKKSISVKNNPEAHYYLGLNHIVKENWVEAEKQFGKAIELDNENANYYLLRGSSFFSQAEDPEDKHHHSLLKKAEEDYTKAISLNKKLEEAYFERGEVRMELSDYIPAIADFKHAIQLKPNDLDAHYLKAMCNFHYGYTDQAKYELEDILKKDPKFEDALYQLGRMELDASNLAKAIEYFDKVIALNSIDSDSYLFRAYAKLDSDDTTGACEDFLKADELGDEEAHKMIHKYCNK